jgi:hypothetical protein
MYEYCRVLIIALPEQICYNYCKQMFKTASEPVCFNVVDNWSKHKDKLV